MLDRQKTVFLMDGTAAAYRAFYAVRDLSNSKGVPTNAVFGFANILKRVIKSFYPQHLIIFFDTGKKTFRNDIYSEYKSHRPPAPDDLLLQLGLIKKMVDKLGITIRECVGYEADDLIATAASWYAENGFKVVMLTSDKDMLQLVDDDNILNYNLNKSQIEDREKIKEKLGVYPENVMDLLALCGDSSDNVPGVKGIGPKTAVGLIDKFGDLDSIYASISDISQSSVVKKLSVDKENAFLSKRLVELDKNAPIDLSSDISKIHDFPIEDIKDFFREMEFRLSPADFLVSTGKENVVKTHVRIEAEECTQNIMDRIIEKKLLIFCFFNKLPFVVCDDKSYRVSDEKMFVSLISNPDLLKIAYNIKDMSVFIVEHYSAQLAGAVFDVMVAAFLVDSSYRDYSLNAIAGSFLKKDNVESDVVTVLGAVRDLYDIFVSEIKRLNLDMIFYDIEMPLVPVLARMQSQPVCVDSVFLKEYLKTMITRISAVKKDIFSMVGSEFNLNSPKQLAEVLFERLHLKPQKKTKTGYSTNETVLHKLRGEHDVVDLLLDYRKLTKLTSTYLEPLIRQAQVHQGRIFPSFSQVSAQTGRLTSYNPNLQNIPVKDEDGKRIRGAFVSSFKEGIIFAADYSQIELRVLAHVSEDEGLIKAFSCDLDIHTYTASLLFDVPETDVGSQQREFAKRINFAIVYGMSAFGLAKELNISYKEAEEFIERYFMRYPGVRIYIDNISVLVNKHECVTTFLGRRRQLSDIHSPDKNLRDYALRQAVNAPIQGAAADIIKLAMINIDKSFSSRRLRSRMLLQVHDELVFDVAPEEYDAVCDCVVSEMENAVKLRVPLCVKVKSGKTWLESTK